MMQRSDSSAGSWVHSVLVDAGQEPTEGVHGDEIVGEVIDSDTDAQCLIDGRTEEVCIQEAQSARSWRARSMAVRTVVLVASPGPMSAKNDGPPAGATTRT